MRLKNEEVLPQIVAVCISKKRGTKKENIEKGILIENYGLKHDAHAGDWHRQVSLLALESIEKMRNKGMNMNPGDYGENFTVKGIDLLSLPIGTRLKVGKDALLEITKIGKEDHGRQSIIPREGIFAKVLKGGEVKVGDLIKIDD